ncbi:MAG: response regulator [Crocinitomicaceae bacterium]|nr:response regulator [Crocinitomicaceae bacterium]
MRAVLIDDEIASREVLENLILRFAPDVNIVGQASNLLNGVDLIRKHKPNVVFLDVQMPNYYGYEINIFFEEIDFQIIFTTAFDEYAVRAFELAALDYLLKPIEIERFQKAISRLRKNDSTLRAKKKIQLFQQNYREEFPSKITLLDKGFHLSVDINEIVAIEGQSAYSKVYLLNGKSYTQSKNLKQMGNLLCDHPNFYRSHKSWLINKQHLVDFSKSKQTARMITRLEAKISRDKMEKFVAWTQQ